MESKERYTAEGIFTKTTTEETDEIECWVRDGHTDEEAAALKSCQELLTALQLTTPIRGGEFLKRLQGKDATNNYFNIIYRCDFQIDSKKIANPPETYPYYFTPQTPSNCDIALPVTCVENHPLNKSSKKKIAYLD
ncbi:hypothetical protein H6F96_21890 [Microcoleus sp. FACHB-53]|nr:hypothetical protein [Microcoleus sp. FACHB-53]